MLCYLLYTFVVDDRFWLPENDKIDIIGSGNANGTVKAGPVKKKTFDTHNYRLKRVLVVNKKCNCINN